MRGELDRVGQEVIEHLLELARVGVEDRHVWRDQRHDRQRLLLRERTEDVHQPLEQVAHDERFRADLHLAADVQREDGIVRAGVLQICHVL